VVVHGAGTGTTVVLAKEDPRRVDAKGGGEVDEDGEEG
jgi:hypothetical protein